MNHKTLMAILAGIWVMVLSGSAIADDDIDGVLNLTPVAEHSCIAVELEVEPGAPIGGLRWFHNDAQVTFPHLLLMEGEAFTPPDLTNTSLILEDITAASLAWGEVVFETPVFSTSATVYAVFQIPEAQERTGEGLGGGPGIGYRYQGAGGRGYLSADGVTWTRLDRDYLLSVEAFGVSAKAGGKAQSLAGLQSSAPAGWWDDLAALPAQIAEENKDGDSPAPRRLRLELVPNPFNPRTTVKFHVVSEGVVSIDVYDIRGRKVRNLVSASHSPGEYEVIWEGTDRSDRAVASGVYFFRMTTPGGHMEKRATLVR